MAVSPPVDPAAPAPVDPADHGVRRVTTDDEPVQQNEHIGQGGEFVLPDVVPIIVEGHHSIVGKYANEAWIRTHYLLRGVAGTGVEWFVFLAGAASQYPKVSVVLLSFAAMIAEERWSEQPMLTNAIKYAMTAYDPDAADKIFAPKLLDTDPIGTAARKVTDEATKAFLTSADYRILKDDIEQDVQRQIRRQAYVAAGMADDVAAIDAEAAEARHARAEARRAKEPAPAGVVAAPAPRATVPAAAPAAATQGEPFTPATDAGSDGASAPADATGDEAADADGGAEQQVQDELPPAPRWANGDAPARPHKRKPKAP